MIKSQLLYQLSYRGDQTAENIVAPDSFVNKRAEIIFARAFAIIGYLRRRLPSLVLGPLGQPRKSEDFGGYEDEGDLMGCTVQRLFKKTKEPPSLESG